MTDTFDVAIIGLGFSGTLTLANLVMSDTTPSRIALIDPSQNSWRGLAYSTSHPSHLLNVRAGAMGAFAHDTHHFLQWLHSAGGKQAAHARGIIQNFTSDDFVPRTLYGDYLEHVAEESLAIARAQNIEIVHLRTSLTNISTHRNLSELHCNDGTRLKARAVVLATGNRFDETGKDAATRLPWFATPNDWHNNHDGRIVLIGAGLTAMDMAASLLADGYKGTLLCISRHGLLPHAHTNSTPGDMHQHIALLCQGRLSERIQLFRRLVHESVTDWRALLDGLRPYTAALWQSLSENDQKRFLSRLLSFWNIHRHRMDATQRARIISSPQFVHQRASVLEAIPRTVRLQDATGMHELHADLVLDCRGPSYRALPAAIKQAVNAGLLVSHPLGGLVSNARYRVSQEDAPPIFALGALLFGERFETTAIPELRIQAENIGNILIKTSQN